MGSIAARLCVTLGIASSAAALAAEPPGDIVASLGPLAGAVAVDVSLDGSGAAAAFPPPPGSDRSTIRIVAAGRAPDSLEVPGDVRALLFDPAGSPLYVVVHRAPKRHPTESTLLRIDATTLKTLQRVTLPVTTRSIDLDGERTAILVACSDEIRTFALPLLTSGPLYRLPGENLAVAALPGSMRVLVGRPDGIAIIDPRSQQGRDGIPILARVKTPGPVAELVPGLDGADVVARLADGRTFRVDLGAMTIEEGDPAPYLAHVRPAENSLAAAPPPAPPRAPDPSAAAVEGEKSRLPDLPASVAAGATAGAAVGAAAASSFPAASPAPKTVEPPAPPPAVVVAPEVIQEKPVAAIPPPPPQPAVAPPPSPPHAVESKAPPPAAESTSATTGALKGTVAGPAASLVVAIVLFGPNSVLHEAARTAPDATGGFAFVGLAPGRYRVVPDGGGKKALVSEPAFVTVDVTPGSDVVAPQLTIVRAL